MTPWIQILSIAFCLITIGPRAASALAVEGRVGDEPAAGTLEVTFAFNKAEGVVPSYQIAVWLETADGKLVKTLYVSEYLSGGGFNLEDVCPAWVKLADWDKAEESEFDAVTRPTPPVGTNTLKFDCKERKISAGDYRLCVQAHIVENYNILYKTAITVGRGPAEAAGEAFYSPRKHPAASEVLSGVRIRFLPGVVENKPEKDQR
jgi:hypothetical protein